MDQPRTLHADRCADLARCRHLALLLDLDGTLVPFADTPAEADIDTPTAALLRSLIELGVAVVVVSGRLRRDVDPLRARIHGAWWAAEHGTWRDDGRGWVHLGSDHAELDRLTERLDAVVTGALGARLERKSASVCLHWRRVPTSDRAELIDLAEQVVDEWIDEHPAYERLGGVDLIEVRRRGMHKGTAVEWIREQCAGVRILAIGDDVTDEDMFRALQPDDTAIVVGRPGDRASAAQLAVDDIAGVRRFLTWLRDARGGLDPATPAPVQSLPTEPPPTERSSLVVISNRTPAVSEGRRREVGGLVAALEPALRANDGVWLGWSGQQREGTLALRVDRDASPMRACFDLSARQRRLFYAGFCNRALWPMLHGLIGRVRYEDAEWEEYRAVNESYARLATELAHPHGTIWVHDYQLMLVPEALRRRGHVGPIGVFHHVPFPPRDVVETNPWARQLLSAMLGADLLGFHTGEWAANFVGAARAIVGAGWDGRRLLHGAGATTVATFPIAIDAADFRTDAETTPAPDVAGLRAMLGDRRMILGVDRLDYAKGIPERLEAFERVLERSPQWRGRVTFVQVSVPSRADVPEYAELRARVEHLVGRINGHFGEADWVPVRYLYRSYGRDVLAQLYRLADVAIVSSLRDGMNLVAKEFVAAQDPARPGVLVLSRFAGAAEEMKAALLTNPFHRDGMAADLEHALSMPAEERRDRHVRLLRVVERVTTADWARSFLDALAATRTGAEVRRTG